MNFKEAIEYLQKNENHKVKDNLGNIYNTYGCVVFMDEDYITTENILKMLDEEFKVLKMNFKEAIEYMKDGGKVKHNDNIYFIHEPPIMESNGEPNDHYELYENDCNIDWKNIDKLFNCEFEVVE